MKHLAITSIALLCAACPGTLDDPNAFTLDPSLAQEHDAAASWDRDAAQPGGGAKLDAGLAAAARDRDANDGERASSVDAALEAAVPARTDAAVPARTDAAASCDFKALMQARCGAASCHGSGGAAAGLDLATDGLAARVGDRKASGACADAPLIDRDDPAQSVLYRRVTGASCGVQMPLGGLLRSDEQACILSWIEGL